MKAAAVFAVFMQIIILWTANALALDPSQYASKSVLASGKWARVEVMETGMQFLSNATLRSLGFNDTSKVKVFGSGGTVLPEMLYAGMTDDLPQTASMQTPDGILFYGVSNVSWDFSGTLPTHTLNPYSETSYYFISDILPERKTPGIPEVNPSHPKDTLHTFTQCILHEKDLIAPSNTGRLLLGEDFKTKRTRDFSITLPGNTGDATLRVCFGAKVPNVSSTLSFSANGQSLPSSKSDNIAGTTTDETFLTKTTTTKTAVSPGETLNLSITFTTSGNPTTAALDYIEIAYPRKLQLHDGELQFQFSTTSESAAALEGCSESTAIWDITDSANPREAQFELKGTTAFIKVNSGYSQFIAFNPDKPVRKALASGKVANQDIHGMEAPDMLIISPAEFLEAARKIAALHEKTDGMTVSILTPRQIYNEFSSGSTDVTAFRKLLKMWHDRHKAGLGRETTHCLLMGRASYDQKGVTDAVRKSGYPRIPIWQSASGLSSTTSYSTDDYIGMLDDDMQPVVMSSATIHTAVGRMPVKNIAEANAMANKLRNYMLSSPGGDWKNRVVVIADDQDNGAHLTQAEKMISKFRENETGKSVFVEKMYLDTYPLVLTGIGATYPDANRHLMELFDSGVNLMNYIGHAHEKGWGHEQLLTWKDIQSLDNRKLPVIFAATCNFLNWDADDTSGGEELWLKPYSGVAAMICPSRKVYIPMNEAMCTNFAASCFDKDGKPVTIGRALAETKNAVGKETNKLRYCLMGDPAIKLAFASKRVRVSQIGEPDDNSGSTVLKASSKVRVSGHIENPEGGIDTGFNGEISISLYDAEKAVDTNGNGQDGKVMTFNDRDTRLSTAKTKVENGRWETFIFVPDVIENNFSNALLSLYAYGNVTSEEANGAYDDFFLFGSSSGFSDTDGPEISSFYLESSDFESGKSYGPSPLVYATFEDESGINVSDAGIGHCMTLKLDGKKTFSDVADYYEPDAVTPGKGSVAYPLDGLEPGPHALELTVWDNAGNSSRKSISFSTRAGWHPAITGLTTNSSPAHTEVDFLIYTDGCSEGASVFIEVYNLSGRQIWKSESSMLSNQSRQISIYWNLRDKSGMRIPRGLYIYRAVAQTPEGAKSFKSSKLPVSAQ